jgi:hypothetical protein
MQDFLMFKTFITPTLLILFYYIGAMVIPFVSYFIAKWIKSRYFKDLSHEIKESLSSKQRFLVLGMAIFCFLCIEIFWRVMVEFFIAYFDMHDALMKLNLSN